jgi:hypothetical protein
MNIEIVLQIFIIIIGLYLAMFKSYFTEKGKNIATNEDIEELTNKVESVKQKFLEKNASLKSKLDLLTNLQIGHKNDERNALTEFHKSISNWIDVLTSSSFGLIDDYDNEEIAKKIFENEMIYKNVQASQSLLIIYIDDKDLHSIIHNLKINVLEKLSGNPSISLIELKQNNQEFDNIKSQPHSAQRAQLHSELLNKRREIYEKYLSNLKQGYKEIVVIQKDYENYMRKYIKTLSYEE